MDETPPLLDSDRPDVPDMVEARAILPFHLPGLGVRGRLVRLGGLADALLTRRQQPEVVTRLTGKALALAAALATALKFQGSFSIQAKGDGPVSMLVADCTEVGALRGYAAVNHEKLAAEDNPTDAALFGAGYLAFTVEQGAEVERYQGIVAIEGDDLAEMAEHYFATSEQMNCMVRLACDHTEVGWRASALILERVAEVGGHDEARAWDEDITLGAWHEGWRAAAARAATVTAAELLDDALSGEDLLFRLFNGEEIRANPARPAAYGCRCSRTRLAGILATLAGADLDDMAQDDEIVMTCEFCNYAFRFPREDVGR